MMQIDAGAKFHAAVVACIVNVQAARDAAGAWSKK
jgi:hypothetical protein